MHRVGRTGRAGNRGTGISFVLADQVGEMRRIARDLGLSREFELGHGGASRGRQEGPPPATTTTAANGNRNGNDSPAQKRRRRRRRNNNKAKVSV